MRESEKEEEKEENGETREIKVKMPNKENGKQ